MKDLTFQYGVLLIGALVIVWSVYRAQVNKDFKEFNLFDLLMENGKLSRLACVFLGTWLFTSAMMWQLLLDGKMTEGYFTAYGGLWIVPLVSKMFAQAPMAAPTPAGDKQ